MTAKSITLSPLNQQNITLYKNQKLIIVKKSACDNNFLQVNNDEWSYACKELKDSTFKLYIYLASNRNGYQIALSPAAANNATGISKKSYYRAVDELLEKGYLVKFDSDNKVGNEGYYFYTMPKMD